MAKYTFPKKLMQPVKFHDAVKAVEHATAIYDASTKILREAFIDFMSDQIPSEVIKAFYPYVKVVVDNISRANTRLSYGFVSVPGTYATTLTRPDIFRDYYIEQLELLIRNHNVAIEVGVSDKSIPVHFAYSDGIPLESDIDPVKLAQLHLIFDLPNLSEIDDSIANGSHKTLPGEPEPLALFTAQRTDYSLHRLQHYTATMPEHFQHYVLFTNYQFYVDEFVHIASEMMAPIADPVKREESMQYTSLVLPGNTVIPNRNLNPNADPVEVTHPERMPQMPAYHLTRSDGRGITMINIGIGPSNAKTITDHLAVLRPHVWVMLGHCAGLRSTQKLGDYVLAHGYVRDDHVMDMDMPLWVPIPPLAEVQVALQTAVGHVTELSAGELKKVMRTGTVATIDDRNWELRDHNELARRFSLCRAIAMDMESATIAANGFRFRVPYGTLLCVSDRPLHGEIKMAGMASHFYRAQVSQHALIGMEAMELLRQNGLESLHSRKLRSFAEVAFR